jgi:hypothetical protein
MSEEVDRFVAGAIEESRAQNRECAAQRYPAPARLARKPAGDSGTRPPSLFDFLVNVLGATLPHGSGDVARWQRLGGRREQEKRVF